MPTAVNALNALTHRQPNKEDKLLVLVPPRADQISFFFTSVYLKATTSVRFMSLVWPIIVVSVDLSKEIRDSNHLSPLPASVSAILKWEVIKK